MHGFYRFAECVPSVKVGDVSWNFEHIMKLADSADSAGCAAAVFPELCLTSASCGDLFRDRLLRRQAENAMIAFLQFSRKKNALFLLGVPVEHRGRLYNCCVLVQKGKIRGIIPAGRGGEDGIFSSGDGIRNAEIRYAGMTVPFGKDLIFDSGCGVLSGVEIGGDAAALIPPSAKMASAGAGLFFHLSAEQDFAGQSERRLRTISVQSRQTLSARLFVSAGVSESTTDGVCSGHCIAAQAGEILLDSPRFERGDRIHFTDIDLERIAGLRAADKTFSGAENDASPEDFRVVELENFPQSDGALAKAVRTPFVPENAEKRKERCREIFSIQSAGAAKRMEHIGAKKIVLGISGGLDSTLALLVCVNTVKLLKKSPSDVIAVTMPGFGTTDRTYENAVGLCRSLGTELREISIKDVCLKHFEDIGHDPGNRNVVYENAQARERTQILLDIANGESGLCIGTGDLSEEALGWCTFNGDHIAMYSVNCGVPKTLIRSIIDWYCESAKPEISAILKDILATPVSPELLPADKSGAIKQKTEDIVGPYEVHDFFLWHFMKYHAAPEKLLFLAKKAFEPEYPEEKLKKFLEVFLRRFFSQQFKRNCCQDGPKVGSVAFSPRTDWKMASDVSAAVWLADLR